MSTILIPSGSHIDPYLKAHRENTTFVLSAGTYVTAGNWGFQDHDHTMLGRNCHLIGAGMESTKLLCDDTAAPSNAAQHEALTAGSRSEQCDFVSIRGIGIVCPASDSVGSVGLHVWSDRCCVEDVEVRGVAGFRSGPDAASREGFGILINQAGKSVDASGSIIRDVVVRASNTTRDDQYVCGLYVGIVKPAGVSFVQNARVVNYFRKPAHAAFGTNGGVLWTSCANEGRWNRAIFCDTAGGSGTIFSGCRLQAERVAVEFRGPDGIEWTDIAVTGSVINVTHRDGIPYCAGLVLARDGKNGPTFKNVTLNACQLIRNDDASRDAYVGSIDGDNAYGCGTRGCHAAGGWKPAVIGNTVTRNGWSDINTTI